MLNLIDVVELQYSIIYFRCENNQIYEDIKNTVARIIVIICGLL